MTLGVAAGVVVLVYLCIELIKKYVTKTDKQQDMLPIAGVLLGIVFSIAIFYIDKSAMLGVTVGDNLLDSVLTGAGSGLIATGGNQLFKKISKLLSGNYEGISEGLDKVLESVDDAKEFLEDLCDKDNKEK